MSAERVATLHDAMEHQFDEDDNADLVIETDDPVLRAAARIINRFGSYYELMTADDPEFIEALEIAVEEARKCKSR